MEEQNLESVAAEDRIYSVTMDRNAIDWKSFLYELINKEGLNPWDIDLGVLTQKYLLALKNLKEIDFDISGKFLTVAIYLLKTKSEKLVSTDIRGFDDSIEFMQSEEIEDFDSLDEFEDEFITEPKVKEYKLKFRNPIARKRKVNIFDLIKTLEKTFEQSNKRRANFLQRKVEDVKYTGPTYEKKNKDLKQIIEELFDFISNEFSAKSGHINFSHIIKDKTYKMEVLDKFVPLLHLHNQIRVELKQDKHFGEIQIHPTTSLDKN